MKSDTPVPVTSPCNGICQLSGADVCVGCGRTRYEIGGWGLMSNDAKRQVVKDAADRLMQMQTFEKNKGFT